jgi:hypothetical protein
MEDLETLAFNYLTRHRHFREVIYEPEGVKKFPDFLIVDIGVAAEVRRLNQNEQAPRPGAKQTGVLESIGPIRRTTERTLRSLGPPTGTVSWHIEIEYGQLNPARQKAEQEAIRQRLAAFRDSSDQVESTIKLFDDFTVRLRSAGRPHQHCFILGPCNPAEAGGWSGSELNRNIQICVDEKTAKWKASGLPRAKYGGWWLLLVDLIHHGQEADVKIRPQVPPYNWDKIVLISPFDYTRAFEIPLPPASPLDRR